MFLCDFLTCILKKKKPLFVIFMYIFIMLSLLFVSLQIVKTAILGNTPFNNGSTCSLATKVIEVCVSLWLLPWLM